MGISINRTSHMIGELFLDKMESLSEISSELICDYDEQYLTIQNILRRPENFPWIISNIKRDLENNRCALSKKYKFIYFFQNEIESRLVGSCLHGDKFEDDYVGMYYVMELVESYTKSDLTMSTNLEFKKILKDLLRAPDFRKLLKDKFLELPQVNTFMTVAHCLHRIAFMNMSILDLPTMLKDTGISNYGFWMQVANASYPFNEEITEMNSIIEDFIRNDSIRSKIIKFFRTGERDYEITPDAIEAYLCRTINVDIYIDCNYVVSEALMEILWRCNHVWREEMILMLYGGEILNEYDDIDESIVKAPAEEIIKSRIADLPDIDNTTIRKFINRHSLFHLHNPVAF